jgi:hypothetical protein
MLVISIHLNLFHNLKSNSIILLAKVQNFFFAFWLLSSKLIAWESEYHQTLILVILMQFLQSSVLLRVSTYTNSEKFENFKHNFTVTCHVYDQHGFPSKGGKCIICSLDSLGSQIVEIRHSGLHFVMKLTGVPFFGSAPALLFVPLPFAAKMPCLWFNTFRCRTG